MSIAELKEKIVEEVKQMSDEEKLHQVLHFLSDRNDKSPAINAMKYKDQLFKKHNGLLERLS